MLRIPPALLVLVLVLVLGGASFADCPPDCVPGGGPPATDCFVAWAGISGTTESCTDGSPCDTDGDSDGTCTFALRACINVPGLGPCTPGGLSAPPTVKPSSDRTAQQLASALGALDPSAESCTPPGLAVPLKISLAGIKSGTARLTVTASSGGKRDKDKLRLTCQPGSAAPSFARVQEIFTQRCAYSGCHDAISAPLSGNLVLESGMAYDHLVGKPATLGKQLRVQPGSLRRSQLARRILGDGVARGGLPMPQGCPGVVPPRGCLTDAEKFTILSWIAHGAPND